MPPPVRHLPVHAVRFWQRVRLLTFILLMIWLLVSFSFAFYARELVGLALIGVYAQAMKKLDALAAAEAADEN
jgi:uncharacterized membrane protein